MSKHHAACRKCGLPITTGDIVWNLNLFRQVEEEPPVTVLWAPALECYCEECAPSIRFDTCSKLSQCSACDKPIGPGSTKWVVSFDEEHICADSCIETLSDRCVIVYCEHCARRVDFGELAACCPLRREAPDRPDAIER